MLALRSRARLALLLVAVALLALAASRAQRALAQTGAASISTDRQQYQIGDTVTVCYTVPGPGPVVITDVSADGSSSVILSGQDDGTGGCVSGTISPPTGRECVRLDFQGSNAQSSQTCFQVVRSSNPVPQPGPCADPANRCPNPCGLVTFPGGPADPCNPGPHSNGPCADPANRCNNPAPPQQPNQPNQPQQPTAQGCGSGQGASVSVQPTSAHIGDTVTVSGQCFTANGAGGFLFFTLISPDGSKVNVGIAAGPCTQTPQGNIVCASAPGGSVFNSNADGTFMFQITVPYLAEVGPQQLCVESIFTGDVCTPFTVLG